MQQTISDTEDGFVEDILFIKSTVCKFSKNVRATSRF
jgi:hypothetical protein